MEFFPQTCGLGGFTSTLKCKCNPVEIKVLLTPSGESSSERLTFEAHWPLRQRGEEVDAPALQVEPVRGGIGGETHARVAQVGHDGRVPLDSGERL